MKSKPIRDAITKQVEKTLIQLPTSVLQKALAVKPLTMDGRTMDAQLQIVCEANRQRPEISEFPVPQAREVYEKIVATLDSPFPKTVLKRDRTIFLDTEKGGQRKLKLRVYEKAAISSKPKPVMVFLHGGGWVVGSTNSTDKLCAGFCNELDHIIVSVDYRLSPEYPFPYPVEDAIDAFGWIQKHAAHFGGDESRVYVAGDSAGGNMSAVVSQQTVVRGLPSPVAQILIYPSTDQQRTARSHTSLGGGYLLTTKMMDWFQLHYLKDEKDYLNPLASPLLADEASFRALPPTVVATAGFDVLRDEGKAFAEKAKAAGVSVNYIEFSSLAHGFVTMTGSVSAARLAIQTITEQIRETIASL